MTNTPTPGEVAYTAFWATDLPDFRGADWATLHPRSQARWEAAAQAVLAMQAHPATQEQWPFRYATGTRVYWDTDRTHIYTILRRDVDCPHGRPLRFLYRLSRNGVPLDWVEESVLHPVEDEV